MVSYDDYQEYKKICKLFDKTPLPIVSDFYTHLEEIIAPINRLIKAKHVKINTAIKNTDNKNE